MIRTAQTFIAGHALRILAGALAVVALFAVVQTIRIDGLRIDLPLLPPVGPKGLIAERDEARATVTRMAAERKAAQAASDRIATKNAGTTRKADEDVAQELAQERGNADAFIARGGVRRCPAPRADAPAPGDSAGIDAGAGAVPVVDDVPVVTVLPEDVRICTENTVKARAWREWGLAIEANNRPD